jgi:hypothetical protein
VLGSGRDSVAGAAGAAGLSLRTGAVRPGGQTGRREGRDTTQELGLIVDVARREGTDARYDVGHH